MMTPRHDALSSFAPESRRRSLRELVGSSPAPAQQSNVNMHCHSFFSFNAYGWSPCRIAWGMRSCGVYAAGLCDFDVLDGLEEFHWAGRVLGLRTAVHVETRTFYPEFADREIDSPGEPGVSYVMGAGFTAIPGPQTPEGATLAKWKDTAHRRNRELIARINAQMTDIALDYDHEVVPLTPSGNATERHIVRAYIDKSATVFADQSRRAEYWSTVLNIGGEDAAKLLTAPPLFEEKARSRLAKRGGFGYVQPTAQTFPRIDDFFAWVEACGAIPCESWLDGTSAGESSGRALLECSRSKGAAALNIIPDRNWNLADPAAREKKLGHLRKILSIADEMEIPVNIGTEMNRHGQPLVDDLTLEALRPHREQFLRGAQIMAGHTILGTFAGFPYAGPDARAEFAGDLGRKNAFFASVGALPALTESQASALSETGTQRAFSAIGDAARKGSWTI